VVRTAVQTVVTYAQVFRTTQVLDRFSHVWERDDTQLQPGAIDIFSQALSSNLCYAMTHDELNSLLLRPMCWMLSRPQLQQKALHVILQVAPLMDFGTMLKYMHSNQLPLASAVEIAKLLGKEAAVVEEVYLEQSGERFEYNASEPSTQAGSGGPQTTNANTARQPSPRPQSQGTSRPSQGTPRSAPPKTRRISVMHDPSSIPVAPENLEPLVVALASIQPEVEDIRAHLAADGDWKERVTAIQKLERLALGVGTSQEFRTALRSLVDELRAQVQDRRSQVCR